jgi:hypothetical protein
LCTAIRRKWLYDTPDEEFGGCVGLKGGKEKAMEVADRICKNMEVWADREQPASPLYCG